MEHNHPTDSQKDINRVLFLGILRKFVFVGQIILPCCESERFASKRRTSDAVGACAAGVLPLVHRRIGLVHRLVHRRIGR